MAPSMPVRCTLFVIAIFFAGIFAGCLSVRERLAARAERSGGDYRAECGSLASIALAEYLYHSHTNTENNAARSGFCTGGWLSAVSVLGVAAIGRDLKNRKNAPSISVRCTLLVIATIFIGIFADCITVRKRLAARTGRSGGDYRAERRSLASVAFTEYLYYPHANTRNNIADSSFCNRGRLFAVSVLGVAAIRRNLKNRRNAPPVSVRCTLLISQRTPCSESRAFGWRLPSRMRNPYKYCSCRIPIPFPHKYRKQRCPFRFLHRRMAVCCICFGSCCNQAGFEYIGGIESSSC